MVGQRGVEHAFPPGPADMLEHPMEPFGFGVKILLRLGVNTPCEAFIPSPP